MLPDLYPLVRSVHKPSVLGNGPLKAKGITVHHAADRDLQRVIDHGFLVREGYHLIIDNDGFVHQTAYLNLEVSHAGRAHWQGLSPNRAHVAVALLSWGRVEPTHVYGSYRTWAGTLLDAPAVRRRPDVHGHLADWDAATPEQERSLFDVLRWLMIAGGIDSANVCGHDECALPAGRKDDPGGALLSPMPELRRLLAAVKPR
jgi:N-acetyl-anhydromuramyl-L-alanine amidase AmpD